MEGLLIQLLGNTPTLVAVLIVYHHITRRVDKNEHLIESHADRLKILETKGKRYA